MSRAEPPLHDELTPADVAFLNCLWDKLEAAMATSLQRDVLVHLDSIAALCGEIQTLIADRTGDTL